MYLWSERWPTGLGMWASRFCHKKQRSLRLLEHLKLRHLGQVCTGQELVQLMLVEAQGTVVVSIFIEVSRGVSGSNKRQHHQYGRKPYSDKSMNFAPWKLHAPYSGDL